MVGSRDVLWGTAGYAIQLGVGEVVDRVERLDGGNFGEIVAGVYRLRRSFFPNDTTGSIDNIREEEVWVSVEFEI